MPKMKIHIFHLLCIFQGVYSQTFDFKSGIVFQSTLNNELESGHRWKVDGSLTVSESELSHYLPYVSVRVFEEICKIWIYPSSSCSQAPIGSDTGSVQCYCTAYANGQYTLKISAVAKTEQSGQMVSAKLTPSVAGSRNVIVTYLIGQLPVIYGKDESSDPTSDDVNTIARRESEPDTEVQGKDDPTNDDPTYGDGMEALDREIRQANNGSGNATVTAVNGTVTATNGTGAGGNATDPPTVASTTASSTTPETEPTAASSSAATVPVATFPSREAETTTTTAKQAVSPKIVTATPTETHLKNCPRWVSDDVRCRDACVSKDEDTPSIKVHDACSNEPSTKSIPCQNLPPCEAPSFIGGGLWTGLVIICVLAISLAAISYMDMKKTAAIAKKEEEEANRPKPEPDTHSQTKPAKQDRASVGKGNAADAETGSITSGGSGGSATSATGVEPQPAE